MKDRVIKIVKNTFAVIFAIMVLTLVFVNVNYVLDDEFKANISLVNITSLANGESGSSGSNFCRQEYELIHHTNTVLLIFHCELGHSTSCQTGHILNCIDEQGRTYTCDSSYQSVNCN